MIASPVPCPSRKTKRTCDITTPLHSLETLVERMHKSRSWTPKSSFHSIVVKTDVCRLDL